MENMDKGLTVPKWVLIVWPKIPQMPQNLSSQFVGPSLKVLDFNENRLHWASVVRELHVLNRWKRSRPKISFLSFSLDVRYYSSVFCDIRPILNFLDLRQTLQVRFSLFDLTEGCPIYSHLLPKYLLNYTFLVCTVKSRVLTRPVLQHVSFTCTPKIAIF